MVELKYKFEGSFFEPEAKELIVSRQTKQVWAVELDLLHEFSRVCEKNGIRWFVDGGTLLGAVRHKGFIPWDDDIDVCLFREDYEKLCRCAKDFESPYFLQTFVTDKGTAFGHAMLRNSDTAVFPKGDLINGYSCWTFNQGISIDIFPLDNVPDDVDKAKCFLQDVLKNITNARRCVNDRAWLKHARFYSYFSYAGFRVVTRMIRNMFLKCLGIGDLIFHYARIHDEHVQKWNSTPTEICCTIAHWPVRKKRQYYHRKWFDSVTYLDFEGMRVPAPAGYENLLEGLYGDWKQHVIGGALHGTLVFDVDNSYKKYLRPQ